ncbi:MAG: UMP kinase [Bacteroidetes bacterium]|nr:UMP kinase [Bacteroidota bacterium]
MKFKRVLLKLSGESLMSADETVDPGKLAAYANEIKSIADKGVEVGIVIGGGNIFRGSLGENDGIDRVQGDYMGMLATVVNGMALQWALEKTGIKAHVLSGLSVEKVTERMSRRKAIQYLEHGDVVIICGGTGNPFFTTDSAAVLRALEIKADAVLKGTRVDGVYNSDPEKNPAAAKFEHLTFDEAISKDLKIMDLTAFTLCRENNMLIIVFNFNIPGNLLKVLTGENVGTVISNH